MPSISHQPKLYKRIFDHAVSMCVIWSLCAEHATYLSRRHRQRDHWRSCTVLLHWAYHEVHRQIRSSGDQAPERGSEHSWKTRHWIWSTLVEGSRKSLKSVLVRTQWPSRLCNCCCSSLTRFLDLLSDMRTLTKNRSPTHVLSYQIWQIEVVVPQ